MQVLDYLKKILQGEENIDESIKKLSEDIETEYLTLNAYDEIKKFLTNDSKVQLHPNSRYYFVTEDMWPVLQKQIFKDSKDIKEEKYFFEIVEDCTKIKSFYQKKMIVFEVC